MQDYVPLGHVDTGNQFYWLQDQWQRRVLVRIADARGARRNGTISSTLFPYRLTFVRTQAPTAASVIDRLAQLIFNSSKQ